MKCISVSESTRKIKVASLFLAGVFLLLKIILFSQYFAIHLLELFAMAVYVAFCFEKRKLWHFTFLFNLYVFLDLISIIGVFLTFPIILIAKMKMNGVGREILIVVFFAVTYILIMNLCRVGKGKRIQGTSAITRIGITFLLGVSECILLIIRHIGYANDYILFYEMFLFVIIFSVIIVFLWLFDKAQEQKRLQEMTAYAHRTREVIPSLSRVLEKLEDASAYEDQADKIIRELRMICNSDMERNKKEAAVIKSFDTTGCLALDGQLERYLEEAATQGFHLDVMVRAPIKEILNEQKIELYSLLQVVGDLYRNAYKATLKTEKQGRILLCFGYNKKGNYEISVHDNGVLFPQHVLEHLGERGVTTDGTGHGMADIFEVLECNQISYLLNQDLPTGSIFTKSISLVFDGQGDKRIECR